MKRRPRYESAIFDRPWTAQELQDHAARTATEAKVQAGVIEELRRRQWLVMRLNGGGMMNQKNQWVWFYQIAGFGSKGAPDVWAVKDGRILLVECKKFGGKRSPVQVQFGRFAEQAGCPVLVIDRVDDLREILDALERPRT